MEYKIQVEDNSYTVKIEELPSQKGKEQTKTAEDIAYSAFLSEYFNIGVRPHKEINNINLLLNCEGIFKMLILQCTFVKETREM